MGYAANGFCFPDAPAAAAYACGKEYPVAGWSMDAGGHVLSVAVECTGSVGNVLTIQRSINGLVDTTSSFAMTSPVCDETEWLTFYPFSMSASQGAELGAAVFAAWAVAWGFRAVYATLGGAPSSISVGEE